MRKKTTHGRLESNWNKALLPWNIRDDIGVPRLGDVSSGVLQSLEQLPYLVQNHHHRHGATSSAS